jgi:NADP-dependent 3-hydroxy acid dehydrogenase YdfG
MTGMSDRRKAVKALANGAQDYLVKGRVDVHLLMRAILRHLPAMTAGTRDSVQRKRSAAITRAGSGLGRDIALGLAAKGYRIFGTAMSSEEIADLKQASGGAVTLSQCDITAEAAVRAWASEVATQNEGGLDLLISNAGILTPGPLEVLPLSAIRHEFEVNVFGALAVVNAFLPALRKARGRIVQVTTMTATQPFPFNGPSVASKAAFDAFAAVYRAELKPFGIDVVWRKLYEMFYQAIPDARAEVLDVVAEGDKVVVVDRFGGTHRGELFGRPGTGNHIEWTAIHTCTIRDGKVLEDAIMMDAPAIMQQLGLVPSLTKAAE